jgi:hypothetical protein
MSERVAPPCPHDVGPGIPVCLRCRQEHRVASRDRRRRAVYATLAVLLGVGVLGAAGAAGMLDNELRAAGIALPEAGKAIRRSPAPESRPEQPDPTAAMPVDAPDPVTTSEAPASHSSTVMTVASVTTAPAPELAVIIGEGRTELRDGMHATRSADDVTIHFDTPAWRTRRPEKFESILRTTLPQIYGPRLDTALAAIPTGTLIPPQGLLTDLPHQGLYIPILGGPTLRVWPETRPGEDGPLVIRYRVLVAA